MSNLRITYITLFQLVLEIISNYDYTNLLGLDILWGIEA